MDAAIGAVGRPGEYDRRLHVIDTSDIGAFLGLDDKRLPNSEPKLREVFGKLKARHGTVLVVFDQPASIGALPIAVARDMGCEVAYLPGLTMRRIADLYPARPRPMPATRSSSRTPPGRCPTPCARSSWRTRPSPSWR